jgi:hypothetical protein
MCCRFIFHNWGPLLKVCCGADTHALSQTASLGSMWLLPLGTNNMAKCKVPLPDGSISMRSMSLHSYHTGCTLSQAPQLLLLCWQNSPPQEGQGASGYCASPVGTVPHWWGDSRAHQPWGRHQPSPLCQGHVPCRHRVVHCTIMMSQSHLKDTAGLLCVFYVWYSQVRHILRLPVQIPEWAHLFESV